MNLDKIRAERAEAELAAENRRYGHEVCAHAATRIRAVKAEAQVAAVRRALDDEEANLADDGARLSHSVVRRVRAALDGAE